MGRIVGTFAPVTEMFCVGRRENYYIHNGYHHREHTAYFDDRPFTDQWQAEVYQFASEICDEHRFQTVCDVGCGSASKLLKWFPDLTVVGIDVPDTIKRLRERYPHVCWLEADDVSMPPFHVDLEIAADVIEHALDPDEVLSFICRMNPQMVVLSTPDRNLLCRGTHDGPRANPAHAREWNVTELRAYLDEFFEVRAHCISNSGQCTRCALCVPKRSG